MATDRSKPSPPYLVGLLVAVGLLVGARAVQLAVREFSAADIAVSSDDSQPPGRSVMAGHTGQPSPAPPTSAPSRPSADLASERPAPQPGVRRLPPDPELRAIISAACPHALEIIDREGLPPAPAELPHYARVAPSDPPAVREPIRVAMRPTQSPIRSPRVAQNSGEWLVPPDQWFVAEDKAPAAGPAAAPETAPATAPPATRGDAPEAPSVEPPALPPAADEPAAPAFDAPIASPQPAEGPSLDIMPAPRASADSTNEEFAPDDFGPYEPTAEPDPEPVLDFTPGPAIEAPQAAPPVAPSHSDAAVPPAGVPFDMTPAADDQWLPEVVAGPDEAPQPEPTSPADSPLPVVVGPDGQTPMADEPTPAEPAGVPTPEDTDRPAPVEIEMPVAGPAGESAGESAGQPPEEQPAAPRLEPDLLAPVTPAVPPAAEPPQQAEDLPAPKATPTPPPVAKPEPVPPTRPITPTPVFAAPQPRTPAAGHGPSADPATGAPHSLPSKDGAKSSDSKLSSIEAHRELFAKNCYPSAQDCGECHKKLYDEWRVSSHAYAFVSPMFQKFEQKITDLSQGTVGYFCYRCHSPVATTIGEHRATPLWDMPKVAREGVTCIACHRINERYTKANGERRIVPGDIYSPVYGGIGGDGVATAIAKPEHYKVKTSPDQKGAGQPIHLEGRYFDHLGKAEFCTSCHQVAVHPGIKLEVVWEQYRQSPACKKGVTCQDCHMGLKPGEASGYEITSIAEVGGKSVNKQRKHANHMFYGPNYSISHPGVFPHNKDAQRWTMQQWLTFNWRAGWGTDDFEDAVDDGKLVARFPKEWQEADDRYDAREIIEDNLKALEKKNEKRREIMSEHMHVAGPYFKHQPARGRDLRLHYDVTNLNEGHNVLTASLGAQPQLWANVVLIGPNGCRLWESGYTDTDGDLCDIHSRDVQLGRAPFDHQLFNLQTMFLITGATGTDREMPLPVNIDIDQLAFLRPGAIPITTTNHPPFIRMESRSIAPLGTKRVHYKIPKQLIQAPGRYRLSFRLRNRIEPIWFMRFCDATDEMVRMMNEGILDMHHRSVEFYVE